MTMGWFIGADCGGTNLRLGLVEETGRLLATCKTPSRKGSTPFSQRILDAVAELCRGAGLGLDDLSGLGFGLPGVVDPLSGVVHRSPHFPEWRHFDLAAELREHLAAPVVVANDANCILVGEVWQGRGRGSRDACLFTMGSGIGGALLLDGRLYTGAAGLAGEFGHMTVEGQGLPCAWGNRGWLEMYCSNSGIVRMVAEFLEAGYPVGPYTSTQDLGPDFDALDLAQSAEQGDAMAQKIFDTVGTYLGIGIANLVQITNPSLVLVGGGVSAAWPFFEDTMREEIERRVYSEEQRGVTIAPCSLGDDAGVLGAARLAAEHGERLGRSRESSPE